jgi:lipopolysaccharide transport system permease protein
LLLAAIAMVSILFGHYPGPAWLVLPFGMLLISMFAFGLGMMAGIFNVFVRDVGQVFGVVLQLWFWLTPIVYPVASIPAQLRWLIDLNPMTPLVRIYQEALLHHAWPNPIQLLIPALLATTLVALTGMMFRRAGSDLVDAL